jgi:hypothetical protein
MSGIGTRRVSLYASRRRRVREAPVTRDRSSWCPAYSAEREVALERPEANEVGIDIRHAVPSPAWRSPPDGVASRLGSGVARFVFVQHCDARGDELSQERPSVSSRRARAHG